MAPYSSGDIPHTLTSVEKAQRLLGYQHTHTIQEGIGEALSWYWENLKVLYNSEESERS